MRDLEIKNNGKPIILSDFADNPGGGGYGDSINLLKGMMKLKMQRSGLFLILLLLRFV